MKSFVKKTFYKIFPKKVYRIQKGIAKGLKRSGGFDFIPSFKKQSNEIQFLVSLDLKNKIIYDIGANVGMFSLFFAKSVQPKGKIFSFEPNPIAHQDLIRNIELNNLTNIRTFQLGVGKSEYKDQLIFDSNSTGIGSLNKKIQANLFVSDSINKVEIDIISIDYIISKKGLLFPDLIKIDVEGLEFDVLNGMKNTLHEKKPKLFVEIHGESFEDKETNIFKIVNFLKNYGYTIKHVETDELITIENTINAREGHLYCY